MDYKTRIKKKIIRWNTVHAFLIVTGMLAELLGYRFVFPLLAWVSFMWFFAIMEKDIEILKPAYGPGNWITLLRLAGLLFLIIYYPHLGFTQIGLFAYFLISLDGVDGFIARKTHTTSEFGAWFDMETDAFYVALMGVVIYALGLTGPWILVPGFLRYLYSLGIWIFKISEKQETRSNLGKYIAGFMFVSLPLPFLIPLNIAIPILGIASLAIVFSFARSVYLLIE